MKPFGRLAIAWLALVGGASVAWGQGWVPLAGAHDGPASVAVPTFNFYGTPASTGLVSVYPSGQAVASPGTTWLVPVCRPVPAAQPVPYAAAYAPPVATYRPAVTVNYVQPTIAYGTVPTSAYLPAVSGAQPVAVAPRVWVKPKVYVAGQPIRNLLRAITP